MPIIIQVIFNVVFLFEFIYFLFLGTIIFRDKYNELMFQFQVVSKNHILHFPSHLTGRVQVNPWGVSKENAGDAE